MDGLVGWGVALQKGSAQDVVGSLHPTCYLVGLVEAESFVHFA